MPADDIQLLSGSIFEDKNRRTAYLVDYLQRYEPEWRC